MSHDRLVEGYLRELEDATRNLPAEPRRELLADIRGHIAEATAGATTEADVRDALERLGSPEEIAAEERLRLGVEPVRAGWRETLAIPLLLVGGVVVPFLGWLAGVALMSFSQVWSPRDKLIGTLVTPGGLMPFFAILLLGSGTSSGECGGRVYPNGHVAQVCTSTGSSGPHVVALIAAAVLLLAPLATAVYLVVRAQRGSVRPVELAS